MRHFTCNGTNQCQNGSSNLLTPDRKQPRSTRIVVAYLRPAFSATKRTKHDLISFSQQAQVSQGDTSFRTKENWNTAVYCGGGLELGRPERKPASSRPEPCASLINAPRILPVRRSFLALVGRKQTVVRDQLFPQKPPGLRLWSSRTGVQHSPGSSSVAHVSSKMFCAHSPSRHQSIKLTSQHIHKCTKQSINPTVNQSK